jgi:integrase
LRSRGYAISTIKKQVRDCAGISEIMIEREVASWADTCPDVFDDAYRYLNRKYPSRGSTVRWLEEYLIEEHGLPHRPPAPSNRSTDEIARFVEHLEGVVGCGESTVHSHRIYVSRFLEFVGFEHDAGALNGLTSTNVDDFIGVCSKTLNRDSLQHVVGYLRAFLRFEYSHGALSVPLHERIDSPRVYRLEKLPRSVPWSTVEALLSAIDRQAPQGKRNYAMLLLMATYGLRSLEVVSLLVDDIKWHRRAIHIRQEKNDHHLRLPLTDAVAEALIDYMKAVRPQVSAREVFLRMYAPVGPMSASLVAKALRREAKLGGFDPALFWGAHCLRHSFAVHLLRQGTSMKTIGDILGHRDADSTCVYLRLATDDLREVALDVPEDVAGHPADKAIPLEGLPRYRLPGRRGPIGPLRSSFGPAIDEYLQHHRSLGKKFQQDEAILRSLDAFLADPEYGETGLTAPVFTQWCNTLAPYMPRDRRERMRIVRNFCLYLKRSQPDAFVPDVLTFPACQPKRPPFILYPNDVGRILNAIKSMAPSNRYPFRQEVVRLSVVLLFTTGIRRGELLRLTLADFDPVNATLLIRNTKFHKDRIVPVSATTAREIRDYLVHSRQVGFNMDPKLPLIRNGDPSTRHCYTSTGLRHNWRLLCASTELLTPRGIPPRIHDLRHSFAVNSLLRWYESGGEPQAKLPRLATYMGHASAVFTFHYLPFVERLSVAANVRFEEKYGSLAAQHRRESAARKELGDA